MNTCLAVRIRCALRQAAGDLKSMCLRIDRRHTITKAALLLAAGPDIRYQLRLGIFIAEATSYSAMYWYTLDRQRRARENEPWLEPCEMCRIAEEELDELFSY